MAKSCIEEGCDNLRYARKRCKYHDALENPDKHGGTLKRSGLTKKKKTGSKSKKKKEPELSEDGLTQYELFCKIWEDREHISTLSGRSLHEFEGTDKFVWCFAHILPKGRYRKLKLKEWNITLLHPDEHTLFDQSTEEKREEYAKEWGCDWGPLFELQATLKRAEYEKIKTKFGIKL